MSRLPQNLPGPDPRVLFQQAVKLWQAGMAGQAEDACRQVLALRPRHPGALQLLGEMALQFGHYQAACDYLGQVPKPDRGLPALTNLGTALMMVGSLEEAEKQFRRALALDPRMPQLHYNLGNVLAKQGRHADAAVAYERAVRMAPDAVDPRVNLANALIKLKRDKDAELCLREAAALDPGRKEIQVNLGNLLKAEAKFEEAEACYRRALAADPQALPAILGLGLALHGQGRDPEAEPHLAQALAADPEGIEVRMFVGRVREKQQRLDEAAALYRRVLELRPDMPEALASLARTLDRQGDDAGAEACRQRLMDLPAASAELWRHRGDILLDRGDLRGALAACAKALELEPDNAVIHSYIVFMRGYDPNVGPRELFQEHAAWGRRHADRFRRPPRFSSDPDPGRRLRLGYVSPDLREHSVAYFLEPVLAHHDAHQFEVFCYSNNERVDEVTRRLRGHAHHWREVSELSDEVLAERIRADGIDLLVDLAGHTQGERLMTFARKPAPVQLTWIGSPYTTGMKQMDYRLTDALADPPGEADSYHTEKLVRLPGCFCCYQPRPDAPEVAPLPALAAGHVTFGSFNNTEKVNTRVLELWARILAAVPGSRLALKDFKLNRAPRRAALEEMLAGCGIEPGRVELRKPAKQNREHLGSYGTVDIGLDPFPYNGVTTTCEALWMGVPVVTLPGDRHAGRTGLTLLTHAGLPELAARSPEDYVGIAVFLARDLPRLAALRAGLRDRVRASPLTDAEGFTRQLESAYRQLWRQYCGSAATRRAS